LAQCEGISTQSDIQYYQDRLGKGESLKIIETRQGRTAPRKFYKFWGGGGVRYKVPNNDMMSVVHAIIERVFYVKIDGKFQRPPVFSAKFSRLSRVKDRFCEIVGKLSPCAPQVFCESYGGNKRRLYENAAESLKTKPLEWRDSWIKCFTKAEYIKPGGVPRLIQPRSPRFNVCLGCYLSPNEKTILHAMDEMFIKDIHPTIDLPTIAKGHNFARRGEYIAQKWATFSDPVCIGVDASRFDQHINEKLLEFEHSIYEEIFSGDHFQVGGQSLKTLLKWQRRNVGRWKGIEGKIRYKTKGCRMSGDMNTSLGNIIIMTSLWYRFIKDIRKYYKNKGYHKFDAQLYNDGDDSVLIVERRDADFVASILKDWFEEFGITMEFDGIYNRLEEITFCQARPVFNGTSWYLCPNPHKRCFTDLVTMKNLGSSDKNHKLFNLQLGAISACGLAANGSTPVLRNLYRRMGTGVELFIPDRNHHLYRYRQELVDGLKPCFEEPTLEHRISFSIAFNISIPEQRLLENFYDQLPLLQPCIVQEPPMYMPPSLTLLEPLLKPCHGNDGMLADLARPFMPPQDPQDREGCLRRYLDLPTDICAQIASFCEVEW